MGGKLKVEFTGEKNILEIYETKPGELAFVMYPDDPSSDIWLEVIADTAEFSALLKRLIGIGTAE